MELYSTFRQNIKEESLQKKGLMCVFCQVPYLMHQAFIAHIVWYSENTSTRKKHTEAHGKYDVVYMNQIVLVFL